MSRLIAKIRRPSPVGLLLAQHSNFVVLPASPHKADELQALLDWYNYTSHLYWFTSDATAERHFKQWLKDKDKDGY